MQEWAENMTFPSPQFIRELSPQQIMQIQREQQTRQLWLASLIILQSEKEKEEYGVI